MLDRQIYLDSLRGTPNRLAGPRVAFWWTRPTDPGRLNLSRKGIGVNTPTNVDSIKSQFISLCKGCYQLPKRERLKALVWFWLIDETLSANLVYQSHYEIGSTTPSDEAMAKIMTMVISW